MEPDIVLLWIPRGDEHELAASLGLCEENRDAARDQVVSNLRGSIRIVRWHVWRVVRAMQSAGQTNTPAGRAAAFRWIADHAKTR